MEIFRGKKYIFSRGIAFYPEKEMQLLKKQGEKGWHFRKMNQVGLLVFEKGKSEELSEYLVIYKQAGWENIANYKKRYFYFKADCGTPTIYSDAESYWIRMKKEWNWLLIRSLAYLPIGIVLLIMLFFTKTSKTIFFANLWIRTMLIFFGILFTVLPLGVAISVIFSLVIYRDRTKYYNQPERFARKQKVLRDSIILAMIGFIVGMLVSILLRNSF